jgi:hypothetical protein
MTDALLVIAFIVCAAGTAVVVYYLVKDELCDMRFNALNASLWHF